MNVLNDADLARAWKALGKRKALNDVAAWFDLRGEELDRQLWAWRARRVSSPPIDTVLPEEFDRLRRLAAHDALAARRLSALGRAA